MAIRAAQVFGEAINTGTDAGESDARYAPSGGFLQAVSVAGGQEFRLARSAAVPYGSYGVEYQLAGEAVGFRYPGIPR